MIPLWSVELKHASRRFVPRSFGTQTRAESYVQAIVRIEASAGRPLDGAVVTAPDGSRYRLDHRGQRTNL